MTEPIRVGPDVPGIACEECGGFARHYRGCSLFPAASPPSLDAPAEQINSSTTRGEPRTVNDENHGPAYVPPYSSSHTVEREATRFVRTPRAMTGYATANGLYVAHSVPSITWAVDGVTLQEIISDHRRQAEADGGTPLLVSEITEALFVGIAIGLIEALPGVARELAVDRSWFTPKKDIPDV